MELDRQKGPIVLSGQILALSRLETLPLNLND
jgi:hypothetical protein